MTENHAFNSEINQTSSQHHIEVSTAQNEAEPFLQLVNK